MRPTLATYRCSSCHSALVHTTRIERHNLACAERGERSYRVLVTMIANPTEIRSLEWFYDFGKLMVSRNG